MEPDGAPVGFVLGVDLSRESNGEWFYGRAGTTRRTKPARRRERLRGAREAQVERLHAVAWQATGDSHLAEDAVQEVFLRLLGRSAPYRREGRAASWLIRATVHAALDLVRRGAARERREKEHVMRQPSPSPEEDRLVASEERRALASALGRLPSVTKACLWLRFAEGMTIRQVAAAVGKGRSATAERIDQGLESLRGHMRSLGFGAGSSAALGAMIAGLPRPQASGELARRVLDAAGEVAGAGTGVIGREGAALAAARAAAASRTRALAAAAVLAAAGGTAALLAGSSSRSTWARDPLRRWMSSSRKA